MIGPPCILYRQGPTIECCMLVLAFWACMKKANWDSTKFKV